MLFFKIIFKEWYHLFRKVHNRRFLWFAFWYGNKKRHQKLRLQLAGKTWQIPDALSFVWQYKEIYGDESYRFHTDNPTPVIYDCGANVGLSVFYFAKHYPNAKIKAFEPDKVIANYLKKNLETLALTQVEIHQKAVWIHNEGVLLHSEGADMASIVTKATDTHQVSVASVRLKDLMMQETSVAMLKIDIEGAEVAVLEDCQEALSKVENLFIEYHAYIGEAQTLSKILNILEQQQFRYYLINPHQKDAPLVNHLPRNKEAVMDLQMNIYGYRSGQIRD